MSKGKVVVAMSGGVDSSVAAALLKEEGYEVMGVTMRLWTLERPDLPSPHRTCCSVEAVDDAQRVCQLLGIPFYLINMEGPFKTYVVDPFCLEYAQARTPNPCLACNQHVKFNILLDKALALGADYLATGHYARVEKTDGKYRLLKAVDPTKDQSYVLYTMRQKELAHLLFPVGYYVKDEIRAIAGRLGLPVADKPDSQEICFIPENDYRAFLRERVVPRSGPVLDTQGQEVGIHLGVHLYTIGQRRGLGVAASQRLYVVDLDQARNIVSVGSEEELFQDRLVAGSVTFVAGEPPPSPTPITAKIRYKSHEAEAVLMPYQSDGTGSGALEVRFLQPQRAITPGQAVVFYHGEEVLGGGTILRSPEVTQDKPFLGRPKTATDPQQPARWANRRWFH